MEIALNGLLQSASPGEGIGGQTAGGGGILSVSVRFLSKEGTLVTFTFSEILHQYLSILKVPLRAHQEDDSQVKSSLSVRDFTQISSSQLK